MSWYESISPHNYNLSMQGGLLYFWKDISQWFSTLKSMTLLMYFWVRVSRSGSPSTNPLWPQDHALTGSCITRPLSQHSIFGSRQETEIKRNNGRERKDQHWNYPRITPASIPMHAFPPHLHWRAETLVQDL